jgi:hypothetical protein
MNNVAGDAIYFYLFPVFGPCQNTNHKMQFTLGARYGLQDGVYCGAHVGAVFLRRSVRHHFHQIVQHVPNLIAVFCNGV